MELSDNTNYLYKKLTEINKKYESNSFVDIDFIELFGLISKSLNTIDKLNQIKKKITAKYYNLTLKYHPDKYINISENFISIINCCVIIDEIKSGEFLSFINDIYIMLNNIIINDPDSLINIINGNMNNILNQIDNSDYYNLKRRFDSNINKENIKATDDQMEEFKNELNKTKIIDSKINENELNTMIINEQDKRDNLQIETIVSLSEKSDTQFNTIFNEIFDNSKNIILNDLETIEITPFNFNTIYDLSIGNQHGFINSTNIYTSMTDISEAYIPIKINNNLKTNLISYNEIIEQRIIQDKIFKNAKQNKI
jgi:hypothetical protein